jgi:hypothetical protein
MQWSMGKLRDFPAADTAKTSRFAEANAGILSETPGPWTF